MSKSLCIFGSGGFAKEVFLLARDCGQPVECFVDLHEGRLFDLPIVTEDYFDPKKHTAVVAIGSPNVRQKITEKLITIGANFETLIHPSAKVLGLADLRLRPNIVDRYVKIGRGTVICAGCILTGNIELGDFTQLNLGTTIGHDVKVGQYFTTAPLVAISGNVHAGDCVYFGTKSCSIEGIKIVDDVTVGAAACVTKDILVSGTYVGVPAKKLEKVPPISKAQIDKNIPIDVREKISATLTGRPGRPMTEELRSQISKSNKGQKRSEETRKNLSIAHKGQNLGGTNAYKGKTWKIVDGKRIWLDKEIITQVKE